MPKKFISEANRNLCIVYEALRGASGRSLAAKYGLTTARISQILKENGVQTRYVRVSPKPPAK